MRLELGCPVHCSDGSFGELADVVVDPRSRRVTHLVVAPHHRHRLARLVPAELARAGAGPRPVITVARTGEDLRALPTISEFAYLRFGEFPVEDPDWEIGIQNVLAQPYYDDVGYPGNPLNFDPHVAIAYDRIPKGEVEIRRSSVVYSSDGAYLGHVDGFLVDRDDLITNLVLERGHLLGRREVTIPVGAVARVTMDSVTLELTKDQVERLPAVPVHRWTARLLHPSRVGVDETVRAPRAG
jgi:sporulation protein YlmC with PRC-barrel domain